MIPRFSFGKKHFLCAYVAIVAVLAVVKWARGGQAAEEAVPPPLAAVAQADSILARAAANDTLLSARRNRLRLSDADGKPVRNRVRSVPSFKDCFPDLNDVQLVTAQRIGVPPVKDRDEANRNKEGLVYVGDNPFYHVQPLSHSIPFLVPRAANLLTHISRAFLDSLASKGLPFHKLIVTSVLRTEDDVARLRHRNTNASSQSCHRYGTTFDISYNRYVTVADPEGPPRRQVRNDTLKWVLSEVLRDQRAQGTCYVKYEVKQGCFHVTAR